MRKRRIAALTAFVVALCAHSVFSEQAAFEVKAVPQKTEAAKPSKELTMAEMVEHIKGNLDRIEEILTFIPEIKKEIDPAGNVTYTYQGKSLEDLDKEELTKLDARVSNEAVRLRTERLNRQLESIRRANQMTHQARQVIQVPKIPAPPPKVPKAPPVPATYPRR